MEKPLIIVTGGTGYIGSHTILELVSAGYEVVSIDNFAKSSPDVLPLVEKIAGRKIKHFTIDLCDAAALNNVLKETGRAAGMIHFAAFKSVPESVAQPHLYYHNNFLSLLNVLQGCRDHGIKNFVFSSSCSVYGDIKELPVSETTALSPAKSPYGYTKVVGERIVADCSKAFGLNAVNLRYFNPVGAHVSGQLGSSLQRPDNLVPVIMQTAVGRIEKLKVFGGNLPTRDGSCIRDYVHVSDIACAHVKAFEFMMNNEDVCEIINLGTGNGVSVLEAIYEFENVSGVKLNYEIVEPREGDVIEIYSDATKAGRLLTWKAEHNLTDMMKSAWQWQLFLENGFQKS